MLCLLKGEKETVLHQCVDHHAHVKASPESENRWHVLVPPVAPSSPLCPLPAGPVAPLDPALLDVLIASVLSAHAPQAAPAPHPQASNIDKCIAKMLLLCEPIPGSKVALAFEVWDCSNAGHPRLVDTIASCIVVLKRRVSEFWTVHGIEGVIGDGDDDHIWSFEYATSRIGFQSFRFEALWDVLRRVHVIAADIVNPMQHVLVSKCKLDWSHGHGKFASILETAPLLRIPECCTCKGAVAMGRDRSGEIDHMLKDRFKELLTADAGDFSEDEIEPGTHLMIAVF
jgi:hypothetical protein